MANLKKLIQIADQSHQILLAAGSGSLDPDEIIRKQLEILASIVPPQTNSQSSEHLARPPD